jgi:hypothetical protein
MSSALRKMLSKSARLVGTDRSRLLPTALSRPVFSWRLAHARSSAADIVLSTTRMYHVCTESVEGESLRAGFVAVEPGGW